MAGATHNSGYTGNARLSHRPLSESPGAPTAILKLSQRRSIMNEVEREIFTLEEELTHTEMRLDVEALESIFADDIMVTAPIGLVVDKPAVMHEVRLAAEKAKIESYDKTDLKVRSYGDNAAVTSYVMTAKARFEEIEINRQLCITNVWMRRDGSWQIVARHTASLEQPQPTSAQSGG
jgi:hypothetical protein